MAFRQVGTKHTVNQPSWHGIGASGGVNTQALYLFTAAEPLFINKLGARLARTSGTNSNVQLAIWEHNENTNEPGKLLGYTGTFAVGAASTFTHSLIWSHASLEPYTIPGVVAAVRIEASKRYWLGIQVERAGVQVSVDPSTVTATTFRKQTTGNPVDFTAPISTLLTAIPALFAEAESSDPPELTLTSPGASVTSDQPTIAGTVIDPQSIAPSYDRLRRWLYEVRILGETDILTQRTVVPTHAQRSAGTFSAIYDGPALFEGGYEVRVQGIDDVEVSGDWTDWFTFLIENLGEIDISSSAPTGKLEYGVYSGNWTGRWTHPLTLDANRAWVRVRSGEQLVRSTPDAGVAISVAHNAIISLTNTQAAVALAADPLPPGNYNWQMQARATDGSLSPWSNPIPLIINSAPNQPSNLRPGNGTTHAIRPYVDWLLTDPDIDDILGVSVSSILEITDLPDGVPFTREILDVNPDTGRGFYDLAAHPADIPSNGDWQFRVRGRDISAVGTLSEFGPWSPPHIFTLVTAPKVTITSPVENAVVATSTPQFTWTIVDGLQAFYEVKIARPDQPPFFSSGKIPVAIPSAAGSYNMLAGWLKPGNIYDGEITIWTAGDISSTSFKRRFTVQYPSANQLQDVNVALYQYPTDFEPVSVAVTWARTSYPESQFRGYVIWRRPSAASPDEAIPIAQVRSSGQLSWIDHHAPPNVALIYSVSQLRKSGNDIQSSAPVEIEIEVPLETPVIASVESGGIRRFPVMWLDRGLRGGFSREESLAKTWGSGGKKIPARPLPGFGAHKFSITFVLRSSHGVDVKDRFKAVEEVVKSGDVVSLRTETHSGFFYITNPDSWWARGDSLGLFDVTLNLEEVAHSEEIRIKG